MNNVIFMKRNFLFFLVILFFYSSTITVYADVELNNILSALNKEMTLYRRFPQNGWLQIFNALKNKHNITVPTRYMKEVQKHYISIVLEKIVDLKLDSFEEFEKIHPIPLGIRDWTRNYFNEVYLPAVAKRIRTQREVVSVRRPHTETQDISPSKIVSDERPVRRAETTVTTPPRPTTTRAREEPPSREDVPSERRYTLPKIDYDELSKIFLSYRTDEQHDADKPKRERVDDDKKTVSVAEVDTITIPERLPRELVPDRYLDFSDEIPDNQDIEFSDLAKQTLSNLDLSVNESLQEQSSIQETRSLQESLFRTQKNVVILTNLLENALTHIEESENLRRASQLRSENEILKSDLEFYLNITKNLTFLLNEFIMNATNRNIPMPETKNEFDLTISQINEHIDNITDELLLLRRKNNILRKENEELKEVNVDLEERISALGLRYERTRMYDLRLRNIEE